MPNDNSFSLTQFFHRAKWALALGAGLLGAASPLQASLSEADYIALLKIAEQKVERQRAARLNPGAISSTVLKLLFGRYYQVGDHWDVAAWTQTNAMARMTSDPNQLKNSLSTGGVFHYEVVDVKNGPNPQVEIKVTQLSSLGLGPVDPKVESLQLTMNDQLVQSRKSYRFVGRRNPVSVSAEGVHTSVTPLELYPLDVPEVATAVREPAKKLPELPAKAQAIANQVGFKPSLEQSFTFEQEDFFGRPVSLLWQHGDPWPAYLKTTNGIAILIHKGSNE